MKRSPQSFILCSLGLAAAIWLAAVSPSQAYVHPCLLNNSTDLNRAKTGISQGTEPWRSAWERLQGSWIPGANGSYTPSPQATVTDTGSRSQSICNDSMAAYVNAVEWYMTGSQTNAATAVKILNAWSSTCTTINGSNAQLAAAFDFFDMVNAAEIMRTNSAVWSTADVTKFQNFLKNVVYPPCSPSSTNGWGASANVMMMQIGVFCDNPTIYNQGYNNFTGTNASVACWTSLFDPNAASVGQVSESGRDQGHAQLIVRCGLQAAEIALNSSNQNLFTFHNNLLLSATEYTAKYNLGHAVTWTAASAARINTASPPRRGAILPRCTPWPERASRAAV